MEQTATQWVGCYRNGWTKGDIVEEAYSHPAKFAKGLIFKIIEYLLATGYVTKNDTILDLFGGVGLGALPAMSHGLCYVGVELEPRFVTIGHQNLALWRNRFGFRGGTLLQGDSRQLRSVLQAAGYETVAATVSSPPFMDSDQRKGGSDLYREKRIQTGRNPDSPSAAGLGESIYGSTPGNLGNMKPGALVTSPPFLGARSETTASTETKGGGPCAERVHTVADGDRLGQTPGNLAAMPIGVSALVTSPPFSPSGNQPSGYQQHIRQDYVEGKTKADSPLSTYGTTSGQLAAMPMGDAASDTQALETFWTASSTILAEAFQILKPGAVAVFVLKDYVRGGTIVRFCDEWRRCCEWVGFVFVEEIHALLSEQHGTQTTLFGADEAVETRRVSFFRRLAEKNFGSPKIDHETVLIMKKPAAGTAA